MVFPASFYAYSSLLPLFPIGCFIYFVLQIVIAKHSAQRFSDKTNLILLLCVYFTGALCGIIGYSMHIIPSNSMWCKSVGMAFCFSFLGATKAFLLAYFLRRAKAIMVQQNSSRLKIFILDVVVPIYIVIYYLLYLIFTSILFKGGHFDVTAEDVDQISFCAVVESSLTFLFIASVADFLNAVVAVTAFVMPLYRLMKLAQTKDAELINAMKWNVALSFVATISSALNLSMLPVAGHLIWCFCLGDPFINASCCFFMMGANRQFCARGCCVTGKKQMNSDRNVQNLRDFQLSGTTLTHTSHEATSTIATTASPSTVAMSEIE